MPGGFENSSMKSSFSLSSLQPSSNTLESPEHAALHDRPYSSLRKKPRKDPEIESWRRSWGREANKDEFWAALENNYQYLMDNNLIDSCKEARRDLQYGASPTHEWSFEQFTTQFNELDSWLNSIQDAMFSNSESVIDRKLRLSHMEELQRKTYKRKLFNNQGGRLVARSPDLKTEVAWRIRYLNSKWERLEHVVTPRKRAYSDLPNVCQDVEHELRCLQKWLRSTEDRLPPLNFRQKWTSQEIEDKTKENEVIARDVWTHGRIVRSVVRLCERLSGGEDQEEDPPGSSTPSRVSNKAAQFARRLERRWQLLYLACLERQCHLDQLKSSPNKQQDSPLSVASVDSDEEPVIKLRKLCDSPTQQEQDDVDGCLMEVVEEGGGSTSVCQMEIEASPELNRTAGDGESFIAAHNYTPETGRKIFLHETSKFTSSSRMGKNCATVYFRHKDTDTEGPEGKSAEDSSEEEWTYERSQQEEQTPPNAQQPPAQVHKQQAQSEPTQKNLDQSPLTERLGHEVIQRLVEKAEEIVSSPVRARPSYKCPRVEEWLEHQYPGKVRMTIGDSCDASGEYTTEDDEIEARIEEVTDSIQELDTTLVSESQMDTTVFSPDQQPKVIMRVKKRDGGGQRPWSVSGSMGGHEQSATLLPHSISESAIHQLEGTPTHCSKMESSLHTGSTLSSSTVEDTTQTQEGSGGGYSSNSLRRRKIKLRKRHMGRKSESGSEGLLAQSDTTTIISSPAKTSPTKTGQRRLSYDKASEAPHRRLGQTVESPTSTSATSDEESEGSVKMKQKLLQMPAFRIGPSHTLSAYAVDRKERIVVSNDSSFSEQAWDNYQEKYMSEAYSEELVDSETAKRLLEFGDDYRNFLDSQSDCASSLGRVPLSRRPRAKGVESDNDLDDVWHLVQKSSKHLLFSEQIYNNLSKSSPQLVLASDFGELIANCKENVRCLRVLLDKIEEDTALISEQKCKEIRGLIERWDALAKGADDLQMCRSLRREIYSRKEEIKEISDIAARLDTKLTDWDQLEMRIQEIKRETSRLKEVKGKVHTVNVAVHRFLTDSGHPDSSLKEEVAQLYGLWEDTCHRLVSEESRLEETRNRWSEFDANLAVLEGALRSDSETLRLLDEALASDGALSPSLASSARDLAKLLNEHHPVAEPQLIKTTDEMTGGSLSDSGISDSGSEQDLSERERRLAALRRLARHLEAVLAPGSAAIVNMAKRIEATENELRGLQRTCRELIVRTAVCAEAKCPLPPMSRMRPPNNRCPEEGEKRDGWLWRVIRAAFPFQLALMALFCIACLLEPHCCDSMNTLTISISPQLRYLRGPPPV